jgi:hypothetical protein
VRRRGAGIACLAATGLATTALASAASVSLPRLLAKQISSARSSGVRVLLPSRIDAQLGRTRLYGSGGARGRGYDIQLAAAPRCHDSTACFVAEFWGGAGRVGAPQRVSLAKRITGAFRPSSCGASCAPATIEWREFGSRYAIQYIGSRAALVGLADSAIAAGPR